VAPAAPGRLVVKRDGDVVDPRSYGVGRRADPGEHVLAAELDGAPLWERRVSLRPHDKARVEVPWPLAPAHGASTPLPSSSSSARTWVYVLAGLGGAGLATGLVAGGVAWSRKGVIDANCPGLVCNAAGRAAVNAGKSAALVSSISLPIGLAGAAGATVLGVLSRDKADAGAVAGRWLRPSITVTDRQAMATVEGVF